MRILIATGIFEPEVGGPATYAAQLAQMLKFPDGDVTVITYVPPRSEGVKKIYKVVPVPRSGNRFMDRINFFRKTWETIKYFDKKDVIYTLDWFAAGLPVALAARLRRIPYVVRVGGDYLWEQRYLESNRPPLTLLEFYDRRLYRRPTYFVFHLLIRWVLRGAAHVIFNSDRQRKLYVRFFGLKYERVSTIYNPVPRIVRTGKSDPRKKEFVFWGRFIVMKNLSSLIRAFAEAKLPEDFTLALIGEGPRRLELEDLTHELGLERRVTFEPKIPWSEMPARVKDSRAAIVPSWTDISPNQVYESLAIGLPALVTKENYLSIADKLPATIDPHSIEDIATKLEMLADDAKYEEFSRQFNAIRFEHHWDDIVRKHLTLFKGVQSGNRL